MAKVYEVLDCFELKNNGFEELGNIYKKEIKLDFETDGPQGFVYIFNSNNFQKALSKDKELKKYLKGIGIEFKDKKVVINDSFKELSTNWILKADRYEEQVWLSLTSESELYPNEYYRADILDEYAKEEIENLLSKNIIKLIEVDDE